MVSIVQRIERELPELKMRVRFPLGAQQKKQLNKNWVVFKFGGMDGGRTRDLLRDRQTL